MIIVFFSFQCYPGEFSLLCGTPDIVIRETVLVLKGKLSPGLCENPVPLVRLLGQLLTPMSSDFKLLLYDNSIPRGSPLIDVFLYEKETLRANDEVLLFGSFYLLSLCKFRPLLPSFLRLRLVISEKASLWTEIATQLFVVGDCCNHKPCVSQAWLNQQICGKKQDATL